MIAQVCGAGAAFGESTGVRILRLAQNDKWQGGAGGEGGWSGGDCSAGAVAGGLRGVVECGCGRGPRPYVGWAGGNGTDSTEPDSAAAARGGASVEPGRLGAVGDVRLTERFEATWALVPAAEITQRWP